MNLLNKYLIHKLCSLYEEFTGNCFPNFIDSIINPYWSIGYL